MCRAKNGFRSRLKLVCTPRNGSQTGDPTEAESKVLVSAGPGLCPFENRQAFTTTVAPEGQYVSLFHSFRVLSVRDKVWRKGSDPGALVQNPGHNAQHEAVLVCSVCDFHQTAFSFKVVLQVSSCFLQCVGEHVCRFRLRENQAVFLLPAIRARLRLQKVASAQGNHG